MRRDENNIHTMTLNQMYKNLELLKFDDVSDYFLMKFLRRALFDDPNLLSKYFINFIPSHNHNTRLNRFYLPPIRTELERNFTIFRSIELYNKLPTFLTVPMSDFKFKTLFKEYCFNKYSS